MEENIIFFENGRRPKVLLNGRRPHFLKKEDDLIFFLNGRRPHIFKNGRRPTFFLKGKQPHCSPIYFILLFSRFRCNFFINRMLF